MSKYAPHRRGTNNPRASSSTVCQKCLGTGHFIYECKSSRPYVSRPSRTELLEKPSALAKLKKEGKPSVDVPEEFKSRTGTANKILEAKEKERQAKRAKQRSGSPSSGTDSSDSESDSSSSSSDSRSYSSSDSSRSRERDRKRKIPRRGTPSSDSDDSRRRR